MKYRGEALGIKIIEVEESYTSGTSFLDREPPTKDHYNKKRRVKRGMFVSEQGEMINSDLNGAYQIVRKKFESAFDNEYEHLRHPMVVTL